MDRHPSRARLAGETAKSVGAGLFGATVPNLVGWIGADPTVIHAMRDVAVGLLPAIFLNALMSCLIPAVLTVRRTGACHTFTGRDLPAALAGPATLVLGLAVGGTVTTMAVIHLASFTLSVSGLAANGVMLLRAVQAMLVATVLTPLTITILSGRLSHD